MKKIFFSHPDIILAAIAFVLVGVLVGFFSWGTNDVVLEVRQATVPSAPETDAGFNLQEASQLNLRGLSTSSVPSAAPTTVTVVATTTTSSATSTKTTTTTSTPSSLKL